MKVIKPNSTDQTIKGTTIFLAGTIDNGKSIDWQLEMETILKDYDVTLYNPRRVKWDPELDNDKMNEQINWELNHLDSCDLIFMNILEDSLSPITLLELGLYADSYRIIVCCPDNFWRKLNVEIVCNRFNVPIFDNFDDAIKKLKALKIIKDSLNG